VRSVTWNEFLIKRLQTYILLISHVESCYLNADMCRLESSQKGESRAQSADSSKAYRKSRAFICRLFSLNKLIAIRKNQVWKLREIVSFNSSPHLNLIV